MCYVFRDVDETTRANLLAAAGSPLQTTGQLPIHGATPVASPAVGFQFVAPGQPAPQPAGQAQTPLGPPFIFGSAHGTGMQRSPPTTLAGQFLSHSEGYGSFLKYYYRFLWENSDHVVFSFSKYLLIQQMSLFFDRFVTTQPKTLAPQTASLHTVSSSSKRIMIPDENGFPKYYACDDPIIHYVWHVVQSGVVPRAAAYSAPSQASYGSLPSGGSQYSSQGSVGSAVSGTPSFGMAQKR